MGLWPPHRVAPWRAGPCLLLLAVLLGCLIRPATAEAETLFGPKEFVQTSTAPQSFTELVIRPASSRPPFYLHVTNGNPDGTARLRDARISLNGHEILRPEDVGPHVAIVDTPVQLLPINVLTITLLGPRHGRLEITIEGRGASLTDVTPAYGRQGETITIQVVGDHTHFIQGTTRLWAGPGISVGGAPPGELGPVTVQDSTHLTAILTVGATTVLGPRTLVAKTNGERAVLHQGLTVLAGTPAIAGTTVTTLAGTPGTPGLKDGPGASAQFRFPADVAGQPEGGGVIADTGNSQLRQVSSDGVVSTTLLPVSMLLPAGLTLDAAGRTIIADTAHCVIRILEANGSVATVGKVGACTFADGPAASARFKFPRDVVADASGNLYVADAGNFRVRKIGPDGGVSTLAGSGHFGDADGPADSASFGLLAGIAVTPEGIVIVSDAVFHRLRQIAPDGTVSPFAGTGTPGFADGPAASAQFAFPTGLARDESGNLYIADTKNNLIRRLTSQGMVETIAGTGARGRQDGPGTEATFDRPLGLSPATAGQLLVADTFSHLIRRIQVIPPPTITGLNPTSGVQGETLTLKISGMTLTGATAVAFLQNGTPDAAITAKDFTVNPEGTELTATVTIDLSAALGSRLVQVTTPGGTSDVAAGGTNTFTVLGRITLIPAFQTLTAGATGSLAVQLATPAPAGGLVVTLTSSALGIATVTSPVTVPAGATEGTATVTAVGVGITNLTAAAPGYKDATSTVTVILPLPTLTGFDPSSGKVGTSVTIKGTNFVTVSSVSFNGVPAPGFTVGSATSLTVAVPPTATTGPISVTTSAGTGTSTGSFIVLPTQDFQLAALPNTIGVPATAQGAISLSLSGTGGFTGLTTLAVNGVPVGVTATFSSPTLTIGQSALLTLRTSGATLAGSYPLIISGTGLLDGVQTSRSANITLQIQPPGQTSLTGQVLDEDAKPVRGAVVRLAGLQATTDAGGNFLLLNPPAGPDQLLLIDGGPASTPAQSYPIIPYKVTLVAGQANTLGFTPHLHVQKTTGLVDVSNTSIQRAVTDPTVPGFEMRIPAGVSITGWDGQANTAVSIRKVPTDRSPLPPVPAGLYSPTLYMFYFGKPGGGTPSAPVPITYPNDLGLPPGTPVELWYYDEAPDGSRPNAWAKYGTGTVSPDGSQIRPDLDPTTGKPFGQPRFCCGGTRVSISDQVRSQIEAQRGGKGTGAEGAGTRGGEPVDLATGIFVLEKTDLVLPGRLPVVFTRTYRTEGPQAGPFGPGTSHSYHVLLLIEGDLRTLVLPNGGRIPFPKQPDGTFRNLTGVSFRGAVLTQTASTHVLRFKDGSQWTFGAPVFGTAFLIAQTDRNGNTITLTRSGPFQDLTAITEPSGRQLSLSYGAGNRIAGITDPLGRTVQYAYDGAGRLTSVTDPLGGLTQYSYDGNNRLLTITDPRGITFLTNEYDAVGRVSRQTQADGGTWTFAYTVTAGVVTQTVVTDPRGNPTTHRFNGQGFPLSVTDALGQTTTFTRDSATNQLLATTDPLGRITRFTYDDTGNVRTITDPAGNVRTFTYEPTFNKVTSITDPLGNVTRFDYDPLTGNLLKITDPLGHATQIAYNQFGQPISTTDALGNTTTFSYSPQGDLERIMDPLDNTTQRSYDLVSRLLAQTDPRGQTTRFSYDNLNRLTQIVDALNGVTAFGYDPNGNLRTVTDARGNSITHEYDSMDRLSQRVDQLAAGESFTYDGIGNLVSSTDRKGQTTTFTYDAVNRRNLTTYADGATAAATYDGGGRLTGLADAGAGTIAWTYDALNRVTGETNARGSVAYTYDSADRRTTMTPAGESPVTYTYNAARRPLTIARDALVATYAYDNANRRTSLALPNGVIIQYSYDPASRLTGLTYVGPSGILGSLTYTYDPAGNRIAVGGSWARTLLPDPVPSATYDAANRQLTMGGTTMAFDTNGNLAALTESGQTTIYTWDVRDQLTSLSGPGLSASFAYDAAGRRTVRTINGLTTGYQYDGPDTIHETGPAIVTYLRALAIDDHLARLTGAATEYYLPDALGNTLALTDGTGTLTTTYTYAPYGLTSPAGPPSANSFQYAGRENDGTGLYNYRTRYYSPALSRFVSPDPIGLAGGINPYVYVGNDPMGYADPSGLDKSKGPLCSVLPEGRVLSLGGGLGAVGGQTGSLQQVVNYSTGEVSIFASGGFQAGWNGVASGTVSGGFIYNLGNSNANFSGPFQNFSVSTSEGPGASVSWAPNGVKVIQASASVTLVPSPTGTYSYTWTSRPLPAGSVWTNLSTNPISQGDLLLYGLRQLCK